MTWLLRYRVRRFFRSAVWIVPLAGMIVGLIGAQLICRVDSAFGWRSPRDAEVYRAVLLSLTSVIFTLIVFVSSALLIALQLASAQLTPRIIPFIFTDRVIRYSLALFVFTFAFAMGVAIRIESSVPLIASKIAVYSCILSLAVFLYLIEYVGRALRPGLALRRLCQFGQQVIDDVYPTPYAQRTQAESIQVEPIAVDGLTDVESTRSGVIIAVDVAALRRLAIRENVVIEIVPQVGDFLARGEIVFRLHEGGARVDRNALQDAIAIGPERTPEQDPTLIIRIMVDIACKALSPAINDPTTAVLAIDQLHRLLRRIGSRWLDDERVLEESGKIRLIYRTPAWDDFVQLAVTEIRHYGGASIQVNRRMRAMLESLIRVLPEARASLLQSELRLLTKAAERAFSDPEDRALADVGDPQGVGSRHDSTQSASAADQPRDAVIE